MHSPNHYDLFRSLFFLSFVEIALLIMWLTIKLYIATHFKTFRWYFCISKMYGMLTDLATE